MRSMALSMGLEESNEPLTSTELGLETAGEFEIDARSLIAAGNGHSRKQLRFLVGFTLVGLIAAGFIAFAPNPSELADSEVDSEVVGETVGLAADKVACAENYKNCTPSKCCKTAGLQCYRKSSSGWGMCSHDCVAGPHPVDINPTIWDCEKLGKRTPGQSPRDWGALPADWVKEKCSNPGQNCNETRCCTAPGNACYKKNDHWSMCKPACDAGPDPVDPNPTPWDCKQVGGVTPGPPSWPTKVADWVADNCSDVGENCWKSGCCKGSGLQCFQKKSGKAQCLPTCAKGIHITDVDNNKWNCKVMGGRTPGEIPHLQEKPGKWVEDKCSEAATLQNNWTAQDCAKTGCCKTPGTRCYLKDDSFGNCMQSCTKFEAHKPNGPMADADGKWSCAKVGPRTPRLWGSPSLFCFHVFRVHSYEMDLVRNSLSKGIGIFGCDQYSVFSSDGQQSVGDGPLGELDTEHFESAPVGRSKDNTAANTALFMNVWEAVKWSGKWKTTDWTIKVDPDAVVIPERLRSHLKAHTGRPVFILTCTKAGMPDGPMMFGSIEAITQQAMQKYYWSESACRSLPWGSWGEDLWLGNCLKAIGVSAEADGIVDDGLCLWSDCGDHNAAAYHPYKDVGAWLNCYWTAAR